MAVFDDPSDRALHMDVLPRITRQMIELFRQMSLVQRAMMIAILVSLLFGFGWLFFLKSGSDFRQLSFGKAFVGEELASAEQALISAGLTRFRRDGQKLLAPEKELDRYNAALLQSDALPGDLGAQILKQYETLGPFSTDRQRQQMKEALLLQELRRIIKAVPDIQDARVVIAASDRRASWNQKPRTSAHVMVKPHQGREISPMLVDSLRHVVASMVPDLKPIDVTVFDVSKGHAFTGNSEDDPDDSRILRRAQALTRQYEQQIQKALSYIPRVSVVALVDLKPLKSSAARNAAIPADAPGNNAFDRQSDLDFSDAHQTGFRGPTDRWPESTDNVTDKQTVAITPKSVQVSVSIPRDYIREIVAAQTAQGEKSPERINPVLIEEEVLTKVEQIVARLIPADSPGNAISVTCVDRLDGEPTNPTSPSRTEHIAILVQKWGIFTALGIMAIVGMWMLRSRPSSVARVPEESVQQPIEDLPIFDERPSLVVTPPTLPDRVEALREEIRTSVDSDSTASAAIFGRWLSDVDLIGDNGTRKTAILLLSLDQSLAAKVLGKLPREHVERIALAIAGVENVDRREQESVLDEFKTMFASRPLMQAGGPETARELLERTLDRNEVEPLKQRLEDQIQAGPFAFLHDRHADDIRRLIEQEHPQSIAVVCAQLPSHLAAQILAGFGTDSQADILRRLAQLGATDPDLLVEIAALLRNRLGRIPVRNGGLTRAADVLRESPRATSRSVLDSIETKDASLADSLRGSMFSFKDLVTLDVSTLQLVLQKTDHFAWSVALKGSSELLRQHVFQSMTAKMAQAMKEEIHSVGPLRLSEITTVQQQITDAILGLESENQMELPRRNSRFNTAEIA